MLRPIRSTQRAKWVREADKYFSQYILLRDNKTCQRCHSKPPRPQCSHFFGRRMFSVRWDAENGDCLCGACHMYWEKEDREAYRNFKIKQLGQKGFDELTLRAHNSSIRADPFLIGQAYKSLVEQYD